MRTTFTRIAMLVALGGIGGGLFGAVETINPASASSSNESVFAVFTSPTTPGVVIAKGAVDAMGQDIPLSANTIDLQFANGSVVVALTQTSNETNVNTTTCVSTEVQNATYVATSGTGTYLGVRASGTAVTKTRIAYPETDGACNLAGTPVALLITVKGQGPFSLSGSQHGQHRHDSDHVKRH